MKPFVARLMAAAALLSIPAALSAHRMWLLPSATVFSGTDGWVTVDAAVSNDLFFFDHQPLRLDGMKVWQPDGSEGTLQNGATGRYRSVFDVKLDKPGTWKIGTQMSAVMGSFKVDGVEKRLGGRRGPPQPNAPAPLTVADIPANATDVKVTEVSGRNEIFVTAGAPTTTVFKPTGKGLEFAPITHPDELVAGETAKFRFLVDSKPAAGLKVTVIPGGKRYRNDEGARELTTGADGVLSVSWPTAGMYWLNATLTDAKATTPRATERRMSYVTTLEVLTP
ncbi:DUF4198 domain-containing protein [Sphingomonas sp. PAMC26645]|uniref:DUF4198 domain-containing protein n=1 Tax=Sphingomonas sp. PAMC26645 TaxID=2565555 RepID=UPI00109DD332|nr:DUF4198 domain-containing protein [Sphingomonas sp. PAMC26645]QCB43901.1 DUF4198 domain-containing protein [Sphingomonas sp. PAMC26645]